MAAVTMYVLICSSIWLLAVAAMNLPFLNPYLDSVGMPSFRNGCNFATGGAITLPATATSVSPFSFGIQVSQFLRFKARALQLLAAKGYICSYTFLSTRALFLLNKETSFHLLHILCSKILDCKF